MAKNNQAYVVWVGRKPGIYSTWIDCKAQVEGFTGAKFKGFPTRAEAQAAFVGDPARHIGVKPVMKVPPEAVGAIAVDAACSGNPGPLEYRGVRIGTGEVLFKVGPIPHGTNNLGEFLAIVHALALSKERGWMEPIYSDSVSGRVWVQKRRTESKLPRTAATTKIWQLVDRAVKWLETANFTTPVLEWDSRQWGENPADFGRK
jgi:ribonuclease HI